MAANFHVRIPVWKGGLMHPHFHMGTVQSLTHFHTVSVTIWGLRGKKQMRIRFHLGPCFQMGIPIWKWGGRQKSSHLGTPRFHTVFVTIYGLIGILIV
jgi:hypothetical protein